MDEAQKVATTDGVLPPEALYADIFHNTEPQLIRLVFRVYVWGNLN